MLSRSLRETVRLFSTNVAPYTGPNYPFATQIKAPSPPFKFVPEYLRKGKRIMEHLHATLPTRSKHEMVTTLFSRNDPNRIHPGSVLRVTMEHAPTTFTGVLLSIRRRGIDTSILLRNIIQGTGVEMQFFLNSPHLKDIKVIRDHSGKRGGRRVRRAKLYYLRHSPEKMTAFASGVIE